MSYTQPFQNGGQSQWKTTGTQVEILSFICGHFLSSNIKQVMLVNVSFSSPTKLLLKFSLFIALYSTLCTPLLHFSFVLPHKNPQCLTCVVVWPSHSSLSDVWITAMASVSCRVSLQAKCRARPFLPLLSMAALWTADPTPYDQLAYVGHVLFICVK